MKQKQKHVQMMMVGFSFSLFFLYNFTFLCVDVISIGEIKPSAEQIDRAKKLQLPSTFYLYENKEPCKGCPGCKEDTPAVTSSESMFS